VTLIGVVALRRYAGAVSLASLTPSQAKRQHSTPDEI
jgi:hypothetical protein